MVVHTEVEDPFRLRCCGTGAKFKDNERERAGADIRTLRDDSRGE
jgi:hypothetical protein